MIKYTLFLFPMHFQKWLLMINHSVTMPSGNQTSTGLYQQVVNTNNEIDLPLCNAFDGAGNTHNNSKLQILNRLCS